MSDYISREEAENRIDEALRRVFVEPVGKSILSKLPAAEVKHVVMGKWMLVDTEDGDRDDTLLMTWWCNRCGKEFKTAGRLDFDFCPKCGADMRERNNEHE